MVIAAGSYPAGHWFESDRRYHEISASAVVIKGFECAKPLKCNPMVLCTIVKLDDIHNATREPVCGNPYGTVYRRTSTQ